MCTPAVVFKVLQSNLFPKIRIRFTIEWACSDDDDGTFTTVSSFSSHSDRCKCDLNLQIDDGDDTIYTDANQITKVVDQKKKMKKKRAQKYLLGSFFPDWISSKQICQTNSIMCCCVLLNFPLMIPVSIWAVHNYRGRKKTREREKPDVVH